MKQQNIKQQAMLDFICANPEDLAARLAYADWLEERGDPRAEFIRLQMELESPPTYRHFSGADCLDISRATDLRRREQELLDAWREDEDGEPISAGDNFWVWAGRALTVFGRDNIQFRRGFVEVIHCRLVDWIGEECSGHLDRGCYGSICVICHGTARINARGPAIVRACPIREVQAITPNDYDMPPGVNPRFIPDCVRRHLSKDGEAVLTKNQWSCGVTTHAANAVISEMLIKWAWNARA
jgi:uncharacterized protein (TIGR02996 family)